MTTLPSADRAQSAGAENAVQKRTRLGKRCSRHTMAAAAAVVVVVDFGADVAVVVVAVAGNETQVEDFVGLVVSGHDMGNLVQEILSSWYGSLVVAKYC